MLLLLPLVRRETRVSGEEDFLAFLRRFMTTVRLRVSVEEEEGETTICPGEELVVVAAEPRRGWMAGGKGELVFFLLLLLLLLQYFLVLLLLLFFNGVENVFVVVIVGDCNMSSVDIFR